MRCAVFPSVCRFIVTAELPAKMPAGLSRHPREGDRFGVNCVGTKNPGAFLSLNARNVPRTVSIRVARTAAG